MKKLITNEKAFKDIKNYIKSNCPKHNSTNIVSKIAPKFEYFINLDVLLEICDYKVLKKKPGKLKTDYETTIVTIKNDINYYDITPGDIKYIDNIISHYNKV